MSDPALLYVRPWNAEQFRAIGASAFPNSPLVECSEHRAVDAVGLRNRYLEALRGEVVAPADGGDRQDVIRRCRLLRAMPQAEANRHYGAMRHAVRSMFDDVQPSVVLSLTVDSFVIDLIQLEAATRQVPFIGLVPAFVNGFFRITTRGEPVHARVPDEDEVTRVLEMLGERDYLPAFVGEAGSSSSLRLAKTWAETWVRFIWFSIRRLRPGQRFNYHAWSSSVVTRSHLSVLPHRPEWSSEWRAEVQESARKTVYLPLQMVPECTVDYWCRSPKAADYYPALVRLLDSWSDSFTFVVKEHPAVIGRRPPGFYRSLAQRGGVVLVPPTVPSNSVIEVCDATLVWTGTAGFEACLRGTPVFTLGEPYYQSGPGFMTVDGESSPAEAGQFLAERLSAGWAERDRRALVRHLMAVLLPGHFRNDGSWSAAREDHRIEARAMGAAIAKFLRQHDSPRPA